MTERSNTPLDADEMEQLLDDLREGISDDPAMAECRQADEAMKLAAKLLSPQSESTRFVAPFPLPTELAHVLAEYDLITAKADRGDPEWDFVMRAADYRVIRDFFAGLKREGPPTVIINPPRPA